MPSEDEMPKVYLDSSLTIVGIIKELAFFATTGDARNGVIGGGVKVNGEIISDIHFIVPLSPTKGTIIQAGKKKFALVYAK